MNDLLKERLASLNTLRAQLDADSEKLWSTDREQAWKLSVVAWKLTVAVADIHMEWEAEEDRNYEARA